MRQRDRRIPPAAPPTSSGAAGNESSPSVGGEGSPSHPDGFSVITDAQDVITSMFGVGDARIGLWVVAIRPDGHGYLDVNARKVLDADGRPVDPDVVALPLEDYMAVKRPKAGQGTKAN